MPKPVATIEWTDEAVLLLDQTLLPARVKVLEIRTAEAMWEAIKMLRVRGAPAIGIAAAYGVCLAVLRAKPRTLEAFQSTVSAAADFLATSRPTAVNLFWALDRCRALAAGMGPRTTVERAVERLIREARAIHRDDVQRCAAIGRHGAPLLEGMTGVLTHCNTGALATGGIGTALAVILTAARRNKSLTVYADETRPLLQGARLTAWELQQAGVETRLITDSMAGMVLQRGMAQAVIVGADRIAANGDAANKIGTMPLAIVAAYYKVPFYVAAPLSTFDPTIRTGADIPIEERGAEEITCFGGVDVAPAGTKVFAPAFDVAPNKLIAGIVTEKGVLRAPYRESIRAALAG
jgi:methylthioribose-1-phosphate isomerase